MCESLDIRVLFMQSKFDIESLKLKISTLKMNHTLPATLKFILSSLSKSFNKIEMFQRQCLFIASELDVCQKTIINASKRINLMFNFSRWVSCKLIAEDKRKRKLLFDSAQRSKQKVHICN